MDCGRRLRRMLDEAHERAGRRRRCATPSGGPRRSARSCGPNATSPSFSPPRRPNTEEDEEAQRAELRRRIARFVDADHAGAPDEVLERIASWSCCSMSGAFGAAKSRLRAGRRLARLVVHGRARRGQDARGRRMGCRAGAPRTRRAHRADRPDVSRRARSDGRRRNPVCARCARERPEYEASRKRLVWANGAQAFCFSAEDPESLRGPQFDAAWCDELCFWAYPDETLATLRARAAPGRAPAHAGDDDAAPDPRAEAVARGARHGGDALVDLGECGTTCRTDFIAALKSAGPAAARHRQELLGELIEDLEGALWKRAEIEARANEQRRSVRSRGCRRRSACGVGAERRCVRHRRGGGCGRRSRAPGRRARGRERAGRCSRMFGRRAPRAGAIASARMRSLRKRTTAARWCATVLRAAAPDILRAAGARQRRQARARRAGRAALRAEAREARRRVSRARRRDVRVRREGFKRKPRPRRRARVGVDGFVARRRGAARSRML